MRLLPILFAILPVLPGILSAETAPTLEVVTDYRLYAVNKDNEVNVESRIDLPCDVQSVPVRNIVFVLDRSGSMLGPRIEAARKAVLDSVRQLSDRDLVSVVVFGSEVQTLVEAKRKDELSGLEASLSRIEPAGGAALFDALNQGAAQLRRFSQAGSVDHIILVTDGPATKGPREREDFTRLVESFAREGIGLSTIGIGDDFDEDLLADLARLGSGLFRYADKPEALVETIPAEIGRLCTIVGKNAVLSVEFVPSASKIESSAWPLASISGSTVTYSLPYLYLGKNPRILTSVLAAAHLCNFHLGTVRLNWTDAGDGKKHELSAPIDVAVDNRLDVIRDSIDLEAAKSLTDAYARQGFEEAIKQIDKGDFKRAAKVLRDTLSDLNSFSFNLKLDDPEITTKIANVRQYVTEIKARGVSPSDRKILRSGLFNKTGIPTLEDAADH